MIEACLTLKPPCDTPAVKVLKLFSSSLNKLERYLWQVFQSSLIFASRVEVYPSGAACSETNEPEDSSGLTRK